MLSRALESDSRYMRRTLSLPSSDELLNVCARCGPAVSIAGALMAAAGLAIVLLARTRAAAQPLGADA